MELVKEENGKYIITPLGDMLSFIPMQPRFSLMLLKMRKQSLLQYGLILIGILNCEEIFLKSDFKSSKEKRQKIEELHFVNNNSD